MKKEEEILKTMSHSNTSQEELSKVKKVMDEKLNCTHSLSKLLKNMKKCFLERDYLFSKSVQDFLNQLSNYDRKSEVFRYPFDAKGNMILPEQPMMQIDEIKNMIKEVSSELNAIALQLIEDLNLLRV